MGKFIQVATTEEIHPGIGKAIVIDGEPIAIFVVDGEYYAIENQCTHAAVPLTEGEVRGEEVICPLHAARFNIKTGHVLCPPAQGNLLTYPVRVQGNAIEIEIQNQSSAG